MITTLNDPTIDSRRQKRQQRATEQIPPFVEQLRNGSEALTERNFDKLYREYRAFYGSPRMFRMDFYDTRPRSDLLEAFEQLGPEALLLRLRDPESLKRATALALLYNLWWEILAEQRDQYANR